MRRKSLADGSNKNYLAYAVGEIILVVLGILIALAINNWWQNRSDHELSRVYLQSLKDDIQADIENLIKFKDRSIERIELPLERAIDVFLSNKPDSVDTVQFLNDIQMSMYMNIVPFRKGTYEDMMSTGNLKLVKNLKIKNALHDYVEKADFYKLYYSEMIGGKRNVRDVLSKSYPFRYHHNDFDLRDKFKEADKPVNIESLLNNTEVENTVLGELVITKWIKRSFDDMLGRAREIDSLLTIELNKY